MTKIILPPVSNLVDPTTSTNQINNNFQTIQNAFDNTLSRDGTSPDQMTAALDMNSNRIINLPQPISTSEPLRLQDLQSFIGGTLTVNSIPTGGTTGQVLKKNSSTNYDTSWTTLPNSQTNYTLDLRDLMNTQYGVGGWTQRTGIGVGSDITPALNAGLNTLKTTVPNGRGTIYIPAGNWLMNSGVDTIKLGGSYIVGDGSQATVITCNSNNAVFFNWTAANGTGFTGGGMRGIELTLESGLGLTTSYAIRVGGTSASCAGQMEFDDIYITSLYDTANTFWYQGFTLDGSPRSSIDPRGVRVGTINNLQVFNCRNIGMYFGTAVLWTLTNGGCYTPYSGSQGGSIQITDSDHVYVLGWTGTLVNPFSNKSDIWVNGTRYLA